MQKPLLLQLCPFIPEFERAISQRFEVGRLFAADGPAWLDVNAAAVRAVVTGGHVGIANELMERLPQLGIVAIHGVGFDKVDLPNAQARGIRVTNTPDVLTDDVADLAVSLTISLLRGVVQGDAFVRAGQWLDGPLPLGRRVTGKRFGIVGLGRIGQAIAARLAVYGPVAYTTLHGAKAVSYRHVQDVAQLAADSDVLILASAATEENHNMIDGQVLTALGPQGYLVNIARGSLVDQAALISALADQRIAGAALDVFANEPQVPQALLDMPQVILTPHIGTATVETRARMAQLVLENLEAYFTGNALPSALV